MRGRVGESLLVLAAAVLLTVFFLPTWVARADPALTISPASAAVAPLGTTTFVAAGGSGAGYVWSLSTSLSGGSISTAGVYQAGGQANVVDVVQVVDSDSNMATAQVTVGAGVTITPGSVTLGPAGTQTFTAAGGSAPYTWALTASGSGSPTLSATGAYVAGTSVGTDTVQATDAVGNTATATVTVVATISVGGACTTAGDCLPAPDGNRYCVDSVCCSSACTGQCQACDTAGAVGTCVTIAGAPVGGRPACSANGGDVCSAKTCDGSDPNACDVYVGTETTCAAASCVDGVGTPQAVCQGDGGCEPVVAAPCGAFACVSNACATSCTNDAYCSPGSYCNVTTGACVTPDAGVAADGGTSAKNASSGCSVGPGPASGSHFLMGLGIAALLLARRRASRPSIPERRRRTLLRSIPL